ncbi:2-nitropropane dioxygenase [Mycena haematopus]|nr:2-nitropropane dioxygenase [Mycena haematopus]
MLPITTQLTERLNLTSPIICAPMAFASTPELAAAVSVAGGLGSIGAGFAPTQVLREQIQKIRSSLNIPAGEPVPVAVGFIGWILDRTEISDDPRLIAVLDERPTAVWFAFGVNLEKYINQVHAYNSKTGRNTFIFIIVNSVDDARRAALHGVDAVVVQGIEAGGHGGADAPPLFVLLAAILREFQTTNNGKPLVIPAGGISTGAQIAALLTMGADGVALGTRFLFTPECEYTTAKKQALIKADLKATARAMAFDEVGRTMGWPPNYDGRAIANGIMDDYKAGLSVEERIAKFDGSARDGDDSRLIIWAGVGVGLTDEINGAADVLRELHQDTIEHLQRAAKLLA